MHKLIWLMGLVVVVFLSFGCAVKSPSPEEIAKAYYGEFPDTYKEQIAKEAAKILIDPYSAQYEFQGKPQRAWIHNNGKSYSYGWGGIVYINAKNRFGGYVGREPYEYFVQSSFVKIWPFGFTKNLNYVY